MFQELCGGDNWQNVALVTTTWDDQQRMSVSAGHERDQELRENYWAKMVSHGARTYWFNGSSGMAETIVGQLLMKESTILKIQKELLANTGALRDTSAGARLQAVLRISRHKREENTQRLIEHMKQADERQQRELLQQLEGQQQTKKNQDHSLAALESEPMSELAAEILKQENGLHKSVIHLFGQVLSPLLTMSFATKLPSTGASKNKG